VESIAPRARKPKPPKEPALATVTKTGKDPKEDGDINTYITSPCQWTLLIENAGKIEKRVASRGKRKSNQPVLYVNGIKGSEKKHRQQALMTSAFSGGPVEGVFNKSEGMPRDFDQCINDKRTSSEFMAVKGKIGGLVDSFADFVGLGGKESIAQSWVEASISDNPATLALFRKLLTPGYSQATVVAHSQGNIIAANALNAVAALRGKEAIAKMRVVAVGSPVVFWSNVKNVHSFGFKNDAVALMSFTMGEQAAYAGDRWYTGLSSVEDVDTEEPIALKSSYSPFSQLTHTYFLYVAHYWDELVALFP
jgi:hypothetical protein